MSLDYFIYAIGIKSINAEETHTTIDISGFARGMYYVKVETAKGMVVKKFVKE